MSLYPVGTGIAATALALLVVAAWLAIGSAFPAGIQDDDVATPPVAILVGSALTSFALALFASAGLVRSGVIITSVICLTVLFARRAQTHRLIVQLADSFSDLALGPIARASLGVIGLVVWLSAISPPRSADAMRYHLAHIRQIVNEGRWVSIADYHYALPFGWTLSYLPFEMLGIPQGAQVLNVVLLMVLAGTAIRTLKGAGVGTPAVVGASLLFLHPAVLRAFSEANADAYALLVILTITILLARLPGLTPRQMAVLGFMSWIGMQSRYQLVAAGIAAAVVIAVCWRRIAEPARCSAAFAGGSVTALVLAGPFYAANYNAFRNPVWPLMISGADSAAHYGNALAYDYTKALTGSYLPSEMIKSLWTLITTPFLVPLAAAILVCIACAIFSGHREARMIGRFGAAFCLLWAAMAPRLYPRFVLLLLPVAVLGAGFILDQRLTRRFLRGEAAVLGLLALGSVVVFRDNLRYAITGDLQQYHRYTWFYPMYQ
ncbi:MAG: hypothetical protein ABIS03_12130, partial [Gemmatimonadaceae bacterium]